jgi:hypothetical protein
MKMDSDEIDTIIVKLIQDNFLNESHLPAVLLEESIIKFGVNRIVNEPNSET